MFTWLRDVGEPTEITSGFAYFICVLFAVIQGVPLRLTEQLGWGGLPGAWVLLALSWGW